MNILFLDWDCFGKTAAISAWEELGHHVFLFMHKDFDTRISEDYERSFDQFVCENPIDFCFSFNYFPVLSEAAKKHDLPYISFVYDSPHVMLYSYTIINPNNHVFLFDRMECIKLQSMGISTVQYLPLPADTTSIHALLQQPYDTDKLSAEVSFVGSLYHESHNLFDCLSNVNSYTKGYLDAIMQAQLEISGYNFIEEVLPKDIVNEMQRVLQYDNRRYGVETLEYIFAHYVIDRKITQIERKKLLSAAAMHSRLRLYTLDSSAVITNATNMGPVSYTTEMPLIFHNSKINLNISLRSIRSGIPLRCMDILGAGGFLLTNYQADLFEHFTSDVDFVYYEDENDMLSKIDYYLTHDKKRKEIAANGYEKVLKSHTFTKRFAEILELSHIC